MKDKQKLIQYLLENQYFKEMKMTKFFMNFYTEN